MAQVVKISKISGFSLLEVLICVFLFQLFWFFAMPSIRDLGQGLQCEWTLHQLELLLEEARLKALLQHQRIKWQVPEKIIAPMSLRRSIDLSWHGLNGSEYLLFEPDLWLNHANGYFKLQCSPQLKYRLWLNRLGHSRRERDMDGIS